MVRSMERLAAAEALPPVLVVLLRIVVLPMVPLTVVVVLLVAVETGWIRLEEVVGTPVQLWQWPLLLA